MPKARILIVEDESIVAMDIERTLKDLGYDIAGVVSSGEEAIKKTEEKAPDLILMDIVLKGKMDGVEAAEQIRVRSGTPVVYLTAYGDDKTLQRAKLTNPFGYLLKPFEERELNSTIEVALYRHHMERRLKKLTEEWQITFDSIDEFVSIHSRDFKLMKVNTKFAEALGCRAEELMGKICYEVFHGSNEPHPHCPHKRSLETRKPSKEEIFEPRLGLHLEISTSPVLNEKGEITGTIHITKDISDRKRKEELLREREELFRDLFEDAPLGYHEVDAEGIITRVNRTELEMLGWTAEEMLGQPVWKFTSDEGEVREAVKAKITGKLPAGHAFEQTYRKKDGTRLIVLIKDRLLKDKDGRIKGLRATVQDITERKILEGQLFQSQKLESIGQLAAGIAHEINTPIQYVGDNTRFLQDVFEDLSRLLGKYGGLLQTVKAGMNPNDMIREVEDTAKEVDLGYLSEEIPKAIQQTLEGVERVAKIVRAMKEFSHPGTEAKTAIDINKAIESTITISRNEWKYVAEMVTDFDSSLPLVPCLPGEFKQVILNVIVNAAHAIADVVGDGSKGKGTIKVSTRHMNGWAEIHISDTGTGIPREIRHRVFDPFFTTKKVGKGTGQGLAISHSVIVGRHGGTLSFETEIGKGTIFIIRLPLEEKKSDTGKRT